MIYEAYQFQDDTLAPLRGFARWMRTATAPFLPTPLLPTPRRNVDAALEMIDRFRLTHASPGFHIASVPVGNREVPVTEEVEPAQAAVA